METTAPAAPVEADVAAAEPDDALAPVALRILVAEDDEINQLVLGGFLEPYGHAVTMAKDGAAVVELLRQGDYDIVLMDVMMPGTDGVQATRMIRSLPGPKRDIPIIALTANAMSGDRETYLEAGMNDYVSKPIARAELYKAIERRLNCRAFSQVFTRKPVPAEPDPAPTDTGTAQLQAFMRTLDLEFTAPTR
jgi:CheY-like chemotaxis protein